MPGFSAKFLGQLDRRDWGSAILIWPSRPPSNPTGFGHRLFQAPDTSAMMKHPARALGKDFVSFHNPYPVYPHSEKTRWKQFRFFECRAIEEAVVEQYKVSDRSRSNNSAVAKLKSLRRQRSHSTNRFLQTKQALL